jgi:shikimate kinase
VSPNSKVKKREDLAGVPISVGYQSGSHYATIQALEQFMPLDKINLSFKDGLVFGRMEKLLNGEVPACTLFSGPYYYAEQLGFRKVLDCTFMMATMLTGDPDMEDVRKFFRALRRAQADIDLRPELYTKHYKKEFPKRFHDTMDTRRWGPGERIVFEPYTREVFEDSFKWIQEREIFDMFGQETFRRAEREALDDILHKHESFVIATSGSIVTEPGTLELLLASCFTVWVRAEPEEHMKRVMAQGDMRPMAKSARAMDDLISILKSREPLYTKADVALSTTGKTPEQNLAELLRLIEVPGNRITRRSA